MRLRISLLLLLSLALVPSASLADDRGRDHGDPALVAARQKFFGPENVDARSGAVTREQA